jgi:hypothetical protein
MNINSFKKQLKQFGLAYTETASSLIVSCLEHGHPDDGKANNFAFNKKSGKGACRRCGKKTNTYEEFLYVVDRVQHNDPGYFAALVNGTQEKYDVTSSHDEHVPVEIDISQFKPMTAVELTEILGVTIKRDDENKLLTFLCELSAYTESDQLNISFNAPSSTGKSFIPTEIARLFPPEDVMEIGYASPAAFFHDEGKPDPNKKGQIIIDLSRKILVFLDQPHNDLLARMRPVLSHDKKLVSIKIADRNQKQGLSTKNVILKGFPAVVFCTAGMKPDEQEMTRFILLSPQTTQEKIREAINEKILKDSDSAAYYRDIDSRPDRKMLRERIIAIRNENITEFTIPAKEKVKAIFLAQHKFLKPRHQRDISRIMSLIKTFALLNLWFRERQGSAVVANDDDIAEAFKLWDVIAESQNYNLPPFVFQLYKEVILAQWCGIGISRKDVIQKHYEVYGRLPNDSILRTQIIPMLENSGLITQEADQNDKRRLLIYPTVPDTISPTDNSIMLDQNEKLPPLDELYPGVIKVKAENNSETSGRVENDSETDPLF